MKAALPLSQCQPVTLVKPVTVTHYNDVNSYCAHVVYSMRNNAILFLFQYFSYTAMYKEVIFSKHKSYYNYKRLITTMQYSVKIDLNKEKTLFCGFPNPVLPCFLLLNIRNYYIVAW